MNSLKNYQAPDMQVTVFTVEDVVLASGSDGNGTWITDPYYGESSNDNY